MAGSSYYYSMYLKYKKEAQDLEKNIKDLQKIKNSLTGDFYDEQGNVNQKMEDLKEDLEKSVRHDAQFNNNTSKCNLCKEKAATADPNLNNAAASLENEIAALNVKKSLAEQNRDSSYASYTAAKAEERQKMLDALKNLTKAK